MPKFQAKTAIKHDGRKQVKIMADDIVYGMVDFPRDIADEFMDLINGGKKK